MQPLKINGLVTRVSNAGENGKMLTVLSNDLGKISVWGKGLSSQKHPSKSAAAPFSYSEFVLNQKGDIYSLSSASLINSFYNLSTSVEKLSLANYFCALSEAVLCDSTYAQDVLKLLLNSLHYLQKDLKEFFDMWLMFEVKALALAGVMPNLGECVICGGVPDFAIDILAGGAVCENCSVGAIKTDAAVFALLKGYEAASLKGALELKIEDVAAIKRAISITGKFIAEHISKIKARDYLGKIVRM